MHLKGIWHALRAGHAAAAAGSGKWLGMRAVYKGCSGVLLGQLALSHNVEVLGEGLVLEPELQHLAHSCCNAALHDKHMTCIRVRNRKTPAAMRYCMTSTWHASVTEAEGPLSCEDLAINKQARSVVRLAVMVSVLSAGKGL